MNCTTLKDLSPEIIAKDIETALKRAMHFFTPGKHAPEGRGDKHTRFEALCLTVGHDHRLADVAATYDYGVGYRHSFEMAFAIGVEVEVVIRWDNVRDCVIADCNPSWSSCGTTDAVTALAAAKLHLETAERACQAQASMRDALRGLRGDSDADCKAWGAAMSMYRHRIEASNAQVFDLFRAAEDARTPK